MVENSNTVSPSNGFPYRSSSVVSADSLANYAASIWVVTAHSCADQYVLSLYAPCNSPSSIPSIDQNTFCSNKNSGAPKSKKAAYDRARNP